MKVKENNKIITLKNMIEERRRLKQQRQRVVFTNGCFDVIHAGHIKFLAEARSMGDRLIVGLNSDDSVGRLKGPRRPINTQSDRALVLAAMEMVDYIVIFEEDEPASLIEALLPDVLAKGSDWQHYVSGRETVELHGGRVVLIPLLTGYSSTSTIARMAASVPPPSANHE